MARSSTLLAALAALVVAHLATPTAAFGWNHTGHRVTALLAWRDMTPAARTAAAGLLRAHPRYEPDLLRGLPAGYPEPEKWAFMTAATWPDIVRDRGHPMHPTHHKGPWHYVDYAYAPDGDRRGYRDGPPEWQPGGEPQNVFQAIEKVAVDLRDPRAAAADRAIALCWFLHLVGDLHQPLHAVSLVNDDFPTGDRGGNSVLVRPAATAASAAAATVINLHAYWDNRLGTTDAPADLERAADRAAGGDARRDRLATDGPALATDRVAAESRTLAVAYAHLHGHLRYAVAPPDRQPLAADRVPPLPIGYDEASSAVSELRVAQAGYRMGHELSRVLDPSYVPPAAPATRPATRPGGELLVPAVPRP